LRRRSFLNLYKKGIKFQSVYSYKRKGYFFSKTSNAVYSAKKEILKSSKSFGIKNQPFLTKVPPSYAPFGS
jgi:hypothetical protein